MLSLDITVGEESSGVLDEFAEDIILACSTEEMTHKAGKFYGKMCIAIKINHMHSYCIC